MEIKAETETNKVFFPNLDGLRFFAFFLVFLQHGFGNAIKTLELPESYSIYFRLFVAGDAGVSFFFVLSGFLITYLILTEINVTERIDVIAFYIRRILRIFPLYFLVIIWGIVFYPYIKTVLGFSGYVEFGNPLLYFLFLGNFDVINLEKIGLVGAMSTNITWSVAIEEQFYLTWVLLFYFLKPKFYKYLFPSVILASMLFRLINKDDGMVLYFHTFSVISDMAVGGGAAFLAINSRKVTKFINNLNKNTIILVYLIGVTLFWFEHQIFADWLKRFVMTLFYVFIILEQNYGQNSFYKMSRSKRVSSWGKYTYGLYLLHPIAILLCDIFPRLLKVQITSFSGKLLQGIAAFIVSLILSYYVYHYFEKKFLNLKHHFAKIQSGT